MSKPQSAAGNLTKLSVPPLLADPFFWDWYDLYRCIPRPTWCMEGSWHRLLESISHLSARSNSDWRDLVAWGRYIFVAYSRYCMKHADLASSTAPVRALRKPKSGHQSVRSENIVHTSRQPSHACCRLPITVTSAKDAEARWGFQHSSQLDR